MKRWLLLLALLPAPLSASTLDLVDGLGICAFAPALERDPGVAGQVLLACEFPAVLVPLSVPLGGPIALSAPAHALAPDHNCSESGGALPRIANLSTDGADWAWLATSDCELAVPVDLATGANVWLLYQAVLRKEVPTRHTLTGSFTTYLDAAPGSPVASFDTSFTSAVLRVGDRLLVATSNLKTAGSNPEFYPGTVLLFDIDESGPTPQVAPATPPYLVTSDPNPTALTALPGDLVGVTNTGLLDPAFPPFVTDDGSVDVIDPAAGVLLGSIPLGPNPGGRSLAVDPTGSVAVVGSHTLRALLSFDLRGLADLPDPGIDPTLQRPSCNDGPGPSAGGLPCLHSRVIHGAANPLALPPAPGASGTAGFISEVRFGESGDFVAATSFNDNGFAFATFDPSEVALPQPLLPSLFGPPVTLSVPLTGGFGSECCPGPMVLLGSGGGLAATQPLWMTAFPAGAAMLGALFLDSDEDLIEDALDNCPLAANPLQEDAGSVGAAPPDGIGDVCQCGDVDGDGIALAADLAAIRLQLSDPGQPVAFPAKCDVNGDGLCTVLDAAYLLRALGSLGPPLHQPC